MVEAKSAFLSRIAWDNYFRHNPNLLVFFCGSSPSFMIKEVMQSKALYNRSQHELNLKPFSIAETADFLGKKYSHKQILDSYLLVGGIPEYLKRLKHNSSIFLHSSRILSNLIPFFPESMNRFLPAVCLIIQIIVK